MKILKLVWSVGPGGTERAAVNFAAGYKIYGCDSRVLVLGEGDERQKELENAGVDVCFLLKEKRNETIEGEYTGHKGGEGIAMPEQHQGSCAGIAGDEKQSGGK